MAYQLPPILFPRRKRFDQVFEASGAYDKEKVAEFKKNTGPFSKCATLLSIGTYCIVRDENGYSRSLNVTPKDDIVRALSARMIVVNADEIYFEVVIRDDGSALLIAKYNQIIGSVWIAEVDAKTIPRPRGPYKKAKGDRKCKTTTK